MVAIPQIIQSAFKIKQFVQVSLALCINPAATKTYVLNQIIVSFSLKETKPYLCQIRFYVVRKIQNWETWATLTQVMIDLHFLSCFFFYIKNLFKKCKYIPYLMVCFKLTWFWLSCFCLGCEKKRKKNQLRIKSKFPNCFGLIFLLKLTKQHS